MDHLPDDLQNLIWEYTQDPDGLVLSHYRRMVINRSSNRLKYIGGILLMKLFYPLYNYDTITDVINRRLYHWGKEHYASRFHHEMVLYSTGNSSSFLSKKY